MIEVVGDGSGHGTRILIDGQEASELGLLVEKLVINAAGTMEFYGVLDPKKTRLALRDVKARIHLARDGVVLDDVVEVTRG